MPAGSRLATCTTTAACPAARWSGRPSSGFWRTSRPGRVKSSWSTRSHGAWIATSSGGRLRLQIHSTWRRPMPLDHHSEEPTAIRTNLGAIFVSLELSCSTWLITSLSPGGGEKMSKHSVSAGDIAALLSRFSELKQKAFARMGQSFPIIVIQEAGLDGFWIHRVLQSEGIESYVVDAAPVRGFGGGGARRHSNRTKDLDNVTQKVVIKQAQPGRFKAGSSARDAPTQTGRNQLPPSCRQ